MAISARYPRVAVVLGVQPQWHLPLLLCRALSTVSAAWWACQTLVSIYRVRYGTLPMGNDRPDYAPEAHLPTSRMITRMATAQIALSFLWVSFLFDQGKDMLASQDKADRTYRPPPLISPTCSCRL